MENRKGIYMKNRIIKIVLITFLSIIFISSLAVSGGGRSGHYKKSRSGWNKGGSHYKKSRSGSYKGKKKGLNSDKPPGMHNKDDKFKQKGNKSAKKPKNTDILLMTLKTHYLSIITLITHHPQAIK